MTLRGQGTRPTVDLLPWDETGRALLDALNTAEQKRHLGGPEAIAKLDDRHTRYLTYHRPGEVEMLRIGTGGAIVGSIGYWEIDREGVAAYETGWEILPAFHGRGLGLAAGLAMLDRLRPLARYRYIFAFPAPENLASNILCDRLGFEHIAVEDFEYPKGVISPHNEWRLDLSLRPPA